VTTSVGNCPVFRFQSYRLQPIVVYLNKKYNDKGEPIKPKTINDAKTWWEEFCKIVKVKTIRDITSEDIRRYNDFIFYRVFA